MRLKDQTCSSQDYTPILISIPFGAIKRAVRLHSYYKYRNISIPFGAIKSKRSPRARATTCISIPFGAIKRKHCKKNATLFHTISIPFGAIKSLADPMRAARKNVFQFLSVRLKVNFCVILRYGKLEFQFLSVRLKGYFTL